MTDSTYGGATYGGSDPQTTVSGDGVPWRVNRVRVDGIEGSIPPAVPGESASYSCTFRPFEGATDHVTRYQALRDYLATAPLVATYQTPAGTFYRNQAPSGSQLVRIEPIAADATPGQTTGTVPSRASSAAGRWAVITGGSDNTELPETVCLLEIETTTIATTAEFPTRDGVVAARERSGL